MRKNKILTFLSMSLSRQILRCQSVLMPDIKNKDRSLMGNDIGSGVLFKSVCFDFFSTNVGSSVIGTRTSNGFDDITH